MFAGAQYERDWTWSAFCGVVERGKVLSLRWIMMLVSFGRREPHEMVTREGGLGAVNSAP